jgi:zinc transport system ATP-binding protein
VSAPLLSIRDLVAGYGRPVIGPISLDVQAGEVIGLRGANGCGKSTLLNAIADRADVLCGRIVRMRGLVIAYQAQTPVRLPTMPVTGHELLRYAGASLHGLPTPIAAALRHRLDRLSGGQYQLLCVWAAIAGPADLILLDEPTNNLDPEREALLVDMLSSLPQTRRDNDHRHPHGNQTGSRGVLLVSHDRRFLERSCSRVIELE